MLLEELSIFKKMEDKWYQRNGQQSKKLFRPTKKRAKKSKAIEIIHSKVGTVSRRIVHNAIEYINSNWRKSFRKKADTQDARNELSRAMTEIHRKKITFEK